jgi:DNA polymerase-1
VTDLFLTQDAPAPGRLEDPFPAGDAAATRPAGLALPPAWQARLEQARLEERGAVEPPRSIPRAAAVLAGRLTLVEDAAGAASLAAVARQVPLVCVGLDFEFRHGTPGVLVKRVNGKEHHWYDPRSVVPLLLSVALVERTAAGLLVIRYVVDCRRREAVAPLADLFTLPVPFAAHFARAELFCLWRLGLPVSDQLWDSWVAERCFLLGLGHARYRNPVPADESAEAEARERAEEETDLRCGLGATCLRRDVAYPFAGDKERLQRSFLDHPDGAPFTREQLEYAAANAVAVARLYRAQVEEAALTGCLNHLARVEMDWCVTNAAMTWDGVRVAAEDRQRLREACQRLLGRLGEELRRLGLDNFNSHPRLRAFFDAEGVLELFRSPGGYSFDDDHLEAAEARHGAVPLIRAARKVRRLLADRAFTGELVGADGRLHPEHHQLGAASGRNSMSWPNIGGIGRALRPVVTAEAGFAVGEVDLSQIEVGIAAAVYGDPDLVAMFNGGDVYSAMARRYHAGELPPEAASMPDRTFKKAYRRHRDRMKVFTLGIIYNITSAGLSVLLDIDRTRAQEELDRFLGLFPRLTEALRRASEDGVIRGYAYTVSGLRRWRGAKGRPTPWETNWMRNTPVQGSAGVVFKVAGNRLHRRYRHYGARLILPMHDAFVFEAPARHLRTVAKITAEVMRGTVQEFFPALDPQADINIDHPSCWNKDGRWRSLALWMVHPEHARRYL